MRKLHVILLAFLIMLSFSLSAQNVGNWTANTSPFPTYIGIGTSNPIGVLTMSTEGSGNSAHVINAQGYVPTGGLNVASGFLFQKYRGTKAAPAVVLNDDVTGYVTFAGYDGSALQYSATIRAKIDGNPSAGSVPQRIVFETGTTGPNKQERFRIMSDGNIEVPDIMAPSGQTYMVTVSDDGTLGSQAIPTGGGGSFSCTDLATCSINNLGDINISGASNGQVLVFNGTSWVPGTDNVNDGDSNPLNEIQTLSLSGNSLSLSLNGGTVTLPGGGGSFSCTDLASCSINNLGDINISGATNGQVLTFNGTSWVPGTGGGGGADTDWNEATAGVVYNTTDNIGIGTTSPTRKLEIETLSAANGSYAQWITTDGPASRGISGIRVDMPIMPATNKGTRAGVVVTMGSDSAHNNQAGKVIGRLGYAHAWTLRGNFWGVDGRVYDVNALRNFDNAQVSDALGGRFYATINDPIQNPTTGTFYVGGAMGSLDGVITSFPTNGGVAGIIGVDNIRTGNTRAGYFDGRVQVTDLPTSTITDFVVADASGTLYRNNTVLFNLNKVPELEQNSQSNTADIKVLKQENEDLKEALAALQQEISQLKTQHMGQLGVATEQPYLEQNRPNPFNQQTEIRYFVPESMAQAKMIIANLEGQLVHEQALSQKGYGSIKINAGTLAAGTYTYTLIIDGRTIQSRKMIITQ